jgi:hypothetical protein
MLTHCQLSSNHILILKRISINPLNHTLIFCLSRINPLSDRFWYFFSLPLHSRDTEKTIINIITQKTKKKNLSSIFIRSLICFIDLDIDIVVSVKLIL